MSVARILNASALALLLAISTTGCISTQNFGSPRYRTVSKDAGRADVFANMGQPNAIYRGADGAEVFVYRHTTGTTLFWFYSKIHRKDIVVVLNNRGTVAAVEEVDCGGGTTWVAPPMLPSSYPVGKETLEFKPENWTYEAGVENGGK